VFVLTLVTPGTPGPGVTAANAECMDWRTNGGTVPKVCQSEGKAGPGHLTLAADTIGDLISAWTLSALIAQRRPITSTPPPIDRPVIDRTGLEGYFHIIAPDPLAPDQSFFTRVQEELGMKLTRVHEPTDVLVIDSVSMPQPD
jgi:hypothetical protein